MKRKFGQTLRRLRTEARKSMGALARHLGVTVTYVSDVERGNRAPFTVENIIKTAQFLGIDPQPFFEAATEWDGHLAIDMKLNPSQKAREVGVGMLRSWSNLQDEDFEAIQKIINKRDKLFRFSHDLDFLPTCLEDLKSKEKRYYEKVRERAYSSLTEDRFRPYGEGEKVETLAPTGEPALLDPQLLGHSREEAL